MISSSRPFARAAAVQRSSGARPCAALLRQSASAVVSSCSSSARAPCPSSFSLRIQTNTKTSLIVARAGGGGGGGSSTLSRGGGGANNGSSTPQPIDEAPLTADSYVCIGLATCFERDESSGKLTERLVIEPISASSLECMANGARTSFRYAAGTTLGALMRGGGATASGGDALPAEYAGAALCANWARRVEAAARTWQRPHAQDHLMDIAPLPAKQQAGGAARPKARGGFNFSLDDKRVLNAVSVVTDADNVKQDISIDVYGRAEAEAKAREEEGVEEEEGGAAGAGGETGDAHARAEAVRAGLTAPCEHMGRPQDDDSSDDEDELDALLAA